MKRLRSRILVILIFLLALEGISMAAAEASIPSYSGMEQDIEQYIEKYMEKGHIPGLSVVIVEGDKTVMSRGFGYSDAVAKRQVTPDTLFELGSTSKAFTALAILQLEDKGSLSLSDPVTRYIPWFEVRHQKQAQDVTLGQLLHHTSGLPFRTIGKIPEADGDDALELTVRTLVNETLDFKPGEQYAYATINYDVLGYVIQIVTGQSYEQYMQANVLEPLGLNHTYLFREEAAAFDLAKGYKFNLLRTAAYDAPVYRGNTPAGYVITNGVDMAKWLKLQLGAAQTEEFNPKLIRDSHLPDTSVAPSGDGSSYAAGWTIHQSGTGEISHGGNNPNYSSYLVLRPQDGVGVAVMANMNSSYTAMIGQGIIHLMQGKELPESTGDIYKSIDNTASTLLFITLPFLLLTLWLSGVSILEIIRKTRVFEGNAIKVTSFLSVILVFICGFTYSLYRIPDILYGGLDWSFLRVWAPQTLELSVISLFAAVLLFIFYFTITLLYPKRDEKSMFALIILSMTSGLGNAIIIFTVNETLNRSDERFHSGLLIYFFMGIAIYVFGQRLVRTRLIHLANGMVYRKRTELTRSILNTPYRKIETMEQGKIQAALNNDTETISDFSNIVVTGATSLVTLVCCFVYMGTISFFGLLVSLAVIVVAAGMHFWMGKQANRIWEQTRDIQNRFFAFINDLIGGFKELSMNQGKKIAFERDMHESAETYRDKRIKGDLKFAHVNVIGELLFSLVVGAIAFLFPVLFPDLKNTSIRTYVFIMLYMTGPIHGILGAIPNLYRVRISWNRINGLLQELDSDPAWNSEPAKETGAFHALELSQASYRYTGKDGETFAIGPVNHIFRKGEITFITGGNGSGKSTLAKLIAGLYAPESGEVRINGRQASSEELGHRISAVFSDYHLFEKLYGIDCSQKEEEIELYLNVLQLREKVEIQNGVLSTIRLSTGQRKRLALLISYLEDRPIHLFDEWAADQDPEFRAFFYDSLLPALKSRGKCVIAITHDDRFFSTADRVIKMEMGTIVTTDNELSWQNPADAAG